MGKNTIKNKKKKMAKMRNAQQKEETLGLYSVSQLLSKAQDYIDSYRYEKAQKYCQEALKREPDSITALETSASLCLEVGNAEGAKHCLGRAITLQPDEGYSKYLSMGQLLEGRDSLQLYIKGIELIQSMLSSLQESSACSSATDTTTEKSNGAEVEMEAAPSEEEGASKSTTDDSENISPLSFWSTSKDPQPTKASLVRQISTAYCSIAELFMTDLCDEEEAESQCQENIKKAIDVDPTNPEALQSMASFLLVKQEMEQAKDAITKSIELWLPKYKSILDGTAEEGTFDPVEVCPLSYPTRINTAKILIEVEDHDNAVNILEGLTTEDDSVVDVWYLIGWSYYLRGEEHQDDARFNLHRAKQVHKVSPTEDEQLVEHLEELLAELGPLPEDETEEDAENLEEELLQESEEENEEMDTN